ncbi:MAG: hypothetical protein HC822_08460 [Oscillochloris sp.]|nr:hypothetical protein [Oscillochloris sp.]
MFGIFSTALRHKIWFDLWGSKQRTIQAILTIAIGAFVIGAIFTAWSGIGEDTRRSYLPTRPPAIAITLTPPADDTLLRVLRADPQLAAVEGIMVAGVNWRPSPAAPWRPAILQARDDYADQRLALVQLERGTWPEGRQFAVERGFPVGIGDRVDSKLTIAPLRLRSAARSTTSASSRPPLAATRSSTPRGHTSPASPARTASFR